jgi:hypothetical protein
LGIPDLTLDELTTSIIAAGLIPLLVENEPPDDDRRLRMIGTLPEYLELIQKVGEKLVVIFTETLTEEWFQYVDDDQDEQEGDEEPGAIDLLVTNNELGKFREFVGQPGVLRLSVRVQGDHIDHVIEQSWWLEFLEIREKTIDRLEEISEHEADKQRQRRQDAQTELAAEMHRLVDDPQFSKLPTQKAMLQFALRRTPELEKLERKYLRSEIQELKAIIDAKV